MSPKTESFLPDVDLKVTFEIACVEAIESGLVAHKDALQCTTREEVEADAKTYFDSIDKRAVFLNALNELKNQHMDFLAEASECRFEVEGCRVGYYYVDITRLETHTLRYSLRCCVGASLSGVVAASEAADRPVLAPATTVSADTMLSSSALSGSLVSTVSPRPVPPLMPARASRLSGSGGSLRSAPGPEPRSTPGSASVGAWTTGRTLTNTGILGGVALVLVSVATGLSSYKVGQRHPSTVSSSDGVKLPAVAVESPVGAEIVRPSAPTPVSVPAPAPALVPALGPAASSVSVAVPLPTPRPVLTPQSVLAPSLPLLPPPLPPSRAAVRELPVFAPHKPKDAVEPLPGPGTAQHTLLLQRSLNGLGLYHGPLNGVLGPKTTAAVAEFIRLVPADVQRRLGKDPLAMAEAAARGEFVLGGGRKPPR